MNNIKLENRQQAGLLLAEQIKLALKKDCFVRPNNTVIIALPRGGVLVALEIALVLKAPLDVLVSKKIGAPKQSELAVGAVTADGIVIINDQIVQSLEISQSYLESEKKRLITQTKEAEKYWHSENQESVSLKGKEVILVDDGIATGMTVLAAAHSIKKQEVERLIIACPIVSTSACALLENECNTIVALKVLSDFAAIGQFYLDFHQVEDSEVFAALKKAAKEVPLN